MAKKKLPIEVKEILAAFRLLTLKDQELFAEAIRVKGDPARVALLDQMTPQGCAIMQYVLEKTAPK